MADKDPEAGGPSLELPSFGLGRKKKDKRSQPVKPVEATAPPLEPAPAPAPTPAPEPTPEPAPGPELEADEPQPKREFALPALPALRAALVVGALIGLLAVLLTFASLKLCELVRGTDSCGGPGLLLLVATLVVLTYVGGWLLRGFGIDDPGSTSFLAVGLLAVLAMLLFLDVIYNWWMVIVVPLVAMATYALSWWVTTRFVDVGD
jgi:hypothetical protein